MKNQDPPSTVTVDPVTYDDASDAVGPFRSRQRYVETRCGQSGTEVQCRVGNIFGLAESSQGDLLLKELDAVASQIPAELAKSNGIVDGPAASQRRSVGTSSPTYIPVTVRCCSRGPRS